MNPIDITEDAIRVVTTAGISRDVIDLLEKKLSLFSDEISSLKERNLFLREENLELKTQLKDAKNTISKFQKEEENDHQRPPGFDETTDKIVLIMFDLSKVSMERIAQSLGIEMGMVQYHFDLMRKAKFVFQSGIGSRFYYDSSPAKYSLRPDGRMYAVKLKNKQDES